MPKKILVVVVMTFCYVFLLYRASVNFQNKYHIKKVERQIQNNERILNVLKPLWTALKKDINNMELPGHYSDPYFSKETTVYRITKEAGTEKHSGTVVQLDYSCEKRPKTVSRIWHEIFSAIKYFEYAELAKVDIERQQKNVYQVKLYMDALAKSKDDEFLAIYAEFALKIDVVNENPFEAFVVEWKNTKVNVRKNKHLLFRDDTSCVISSVDIIQQANGSFQEKQNIAYLQGKVSKPLYAEALDTGKVNVCDIDNNGWDDLYITSRGRSLLLQNNQGVLDENSSLFGLDVENSSCSLFVDVDNDGDQDAIIGRYIKNSQLFINEEGRFRLDEQVILPNFVISISAADYNRDGLMDLYFSRFIGQNIVKNLQPLNKFFPEKEIDHYKGIMKKRKIKKMNGLARNVLFKNKGLIDFEPVHSSIVNTYTATFQGSWSDFDQDNDADLYIANDFGNDFLFRNNNGEFEDVSYLVNPAESFSMGVSWGDYNNDQRMDLYVSGMYSKAGTRLTKRLAPLGLDIAFFRFAQGNFLYEQQQHKFSRHDNIRGLWSWGSQFGDFDNDGYLDIYTVDGYYTAPKFIRNSADF